MTRKEELMQGVFYKSSGQISPEVLKGMMLRDISISMAMIVDQLKEKNQKDEIEQ